MAIGAALVVALLLLWTAAQILLLLFVSILFALFLRSIADFFIAHTPLGPKTSLTITVVLFLTLAVGGVSLVAPGLAEQVDQLSTTFPQSLDQLERTIREKTWIPDALLPRNAFQMLQKQLMTGRALGMFSTVFGVAGGILVVFFVGLYLAASPDTYKEGLLTFFGPKRRDRVAEILLHLDSTLRWWLLGRVAAMSIVGVMIWIGLSVIGFPLALVLAIVAAVCEFVPYIGPFLAAIPAVILGATRGPQYALYVIAVYIVVQTIESYVMTPFIEKKTVWLPPAVTIMAQVLFGLLWGALGILVATPLTATIVVLTKKLYLEDVLGEEVELSRAGE